MRLLRAPLSRRGFIVGMTLLAASPARAAPAIRLAAQKTGTFAWELDVIANRGLDKAADVAIETAEFASPQAGELALLAGQVDIIISDWLYVTRSRSLGGRLTFYPYSSAIGAIDDAAVLLDLELERSQGKDARGRRRTARQELAHRPRRSLARGPRPQIGGLDRLRRTVSPCRQGAARRVCREPQLLEFLCRARGGRLPPARRRRGIGREARRDRAARQSRLRVQRGLGARQ